MTVPMRLKTGQVPKSNEGNYGSDADSDSPASQESSSSGLGPAAGDSEQPHHNKTCKGEGLCRGENVDMRSTGGLKRRVEADGVDGKDGRLGSECGQGGAKQPASRERNKQREDKSICVCSRKKAVRA